MNVLRRWLRRSGHALDPRAQGGLQLAWAASRAGHHEDALRLAQPFLEAACRQLRREAYQLCVASSRQLARWPLVLACGQRLFELSPSAETALLLAEASARTGLAAHGRAWMMRFDELNRDERAAPPAVAYLRYLAALEDAGLAAESRPYLEWLRELYRHVGSADEARLGSHGLPPLTVFLQLSRRLLAPRLASAELAAWHRALRDDLDDAGRRILDDCLRRDAPAASTH
nr:hypothetical protein [Chromobacterium sp. ASV5]